MTVSPLLRGAIAALGCVLLAAPAALDAQSAAHAGMRLGSRAIGGVVTGAHGPEAGVWVIAETDDLPTKFAKIVVTDDRGRYAIPELPPARYRVWARGYGIVDTARTVARPGAFVDLRTRDVPNAAVDALHYPAEYWFAMMNVPAASEFPGTGDNGIVKTARSRDQWLDIVKTDGCVTCHQLGNRATRTIPTALGTFPTSAAAWGRRIQSGQAAGIMANSFSQLGPRALAMFGDWTDRVAAGELPFAKPPRPQGVERNVVITLWDWATPTSYLHDEIATDKRDPHRNAYGKLYGSPEESSDDVPVLDPVRNAASAIRVPVADPATPSFSFTSLEKPMAPSAYWGATRIWSSQTSIHNPMLDERGRLWITARTRPADDPAYCSDGSTPSSKAFPLKRSGRQAAMYDPASGAFDLINLCFSTHHLQFAGDVNDTLWFSPGGGNTNVVGWLNVKQYLATHDTAAAQGWTPLVLDTAGTGKRTAYVEPDAPVEPRKDKRINADFYGIAVSPVDGTVWGSVVGYPGRIVHLIPGSDPATTALAEVYELPADDPAAAVHGYSPRGMDIDRNGVVWAPLASGHLARFDRRACKGPLNGPTALGRHCPEGWTLYPLPGPQFKNLDASGSAEAPYYTWVDQFDTFGLGANVPYVTGNEAEAVEALVDGHFVVMRVPYPLGFFAKNVDGRIDDPSNGWKGRGLWTTFGSRTPFHMETGKGTRPKVLHFQLRPNPLAI